MELLTVVIIAAVAVAMTVPAVANAVDAGRGREAAGFVAAHMRAAKQQAVLGSASAALVFDVVGGRWTFRVCVDGNGNGIRRADITRGTDTCGEGPYDVSSLYPGVLIDVDATLRGPDGEAPSADPVRFGSSNLASFSPSGSCTAGSIFLRTTKGEQYLVRVAGINGRLRILRYDRGSRSWMDA